MATSALSSLGIGSGVLTYDLIDKLKAADENSVIKPYITKMEQNTEKQAELAGLISILSSMKSSASKLSDYSTYLGRNTTVIGDEVSAEAGSGFVIQDIKIVVNQLAQQDVYQSSNGYSSRDSAFSTYSSRLSFSYGGMDYSIRIDQNQSLEEVAQAITDATDGKVIATIMKAGGANPYQLTLTGADSGYSNKIYFGSILRATGTPSGALSLGTGDFSVSLVGASGTQETIELIYDQSDSTASGVENGKGLSEALLQALKDSGKFDGLLFDPDDPTTQNNPIHIDYDRESGGLIINDARGYDISVSGNKVNTLGFLGNNLSDTKLNIIEGSKVGSGLIEGKFIIGSDEIDLGSITASGNSSAQNAQAIVDYINNNLGATYTAEVGEDSNLIINSATGADTISIYLDESSSGAYRTSLSAIAAIGLTAGSHKSEAVFLSEVMQLSNLQVAQDAKFTYNGVAVSRSSNSFDDLFSGLSITLNGVHESGKSSTIRVTQDKKGLSEDVKNFIDSYNELLTTLQDLTKYDEDLKVAGIFQGVSQIYGIKSALNSILTTADSNGRSLMEFGIYINEDGSISLNEEKLNSKIESDYEGTMEFFRGYTATMQGQEVEFDGVFKRFLEEINSLIDGDNSTLKLYDKSLTDELKTLDEQKSRAQKYIEARYEIMARRFAAYDSMINSINNQFIVIQQMIQQAMQS